MKIVNLTPHDLRIISMNGSDRTLPKSGKVMRCEVSRTQEDFIDGIPVNKTEFGAITCYEPNPDNLWIYDKVVDVPAAEEGTYYVVSLACAQALKVIGRFEDILVTDDAVRDQTGRIIGCRALAKVS